jgi:primosomal protein N' (replication factor Y)
MKVASVIVDVPAKQTDREFDYLVPEEWLETIQPGMRVIVPFGPRKIQGFVTEIKAESEFKKLREICEPMDLEPVLNKELLELGNWLTETTLCFKIYAYQAMLPAALKAKYEKKVMLSTGVSINELPVQLHEIFKNEEAINWEDALKNGLVPILQREAAKGLLEVFYLVKGKVNKKKLKYISPLLPPADLEA